MSNDIPYISPPETNIYLSYGNYNPITRYNNVNQQLLINYNRKKYYKEIIKQNQEALDAPPRPYTPLYFQTGYNKIYYPQKETTFT